MINLNNLDSNNISAGYFPISQVIKGAYIINLGPLLEVEECEGYYNLIIDRMDQKQVIAFKKDAILLVEDGLNDIRTNAGKGM